MPKYWPTLLAALAGAATVALGLQFGADESERWLLASRYTARAGFFFLILAYSASSLARLWPTEFTRSLMRGRKWWGLGFAVTHTFHLYALVNFLRIMPEEPDYLYLSPAIFAYLVLYAMALTSWNWAYRSMGKWWKRLHTFGIHYLWLIYAAAYSLRIADTEHRLTGIVFAAIAFGALGLRIAAWRKAKAKRAAAQAA